MVFTAILLIVLPFTKLVLGIIEAIVPGQFGVNLNVDEDLPRYFKALDEEDRSDWLAEEDNMRNRYQIPITLNESLVMLRKQSKKNVRTITGVHNYDILHNPIYID